MGFRFRRSIKIAPGMRLNVGKRSLSVTGGMSGAKITTGTAGTSVTTGAPGTGLSFTSKLTARLNRNGEYAAGHASGFARGLLRGIGSGLVVLFAAALGALFSSMRRR
jgi:hypothetical protein